MYMVVKKLNERTLEDFGSFETQKEAEMMAYFIKEFIGYSCNVIETKERSLRNDNS